MTQNLVPSAQFTSKTSTSIMEKGGELAGTRAGRLDMLGAFYTTRRTAMPDFISIATVNTWITLPEAFCTGVLWAH